MHTHPLWRPFELPDADAIRAARLRPDDASRWRRPVVVSAYDPDWTTRFGRVAGLISAALTSNALSVEHVGSTAVPGLAAKPVIDIDLLVADSSDEASYVPRLEAEGFILVVRQPEWEEHRLLRLTAPETNLHVFSAGAVEPHRHLRFRDWLCTHLADRDAYAALKLKLAATGFDDVMLYNNAKSALIYDFYESIFAADPQHLHTPRPRVSAASGS
ncbi:GrpB family protein [uncultured Arthrobacter sp.]|uniref:GrpB family protein n=1 Tax=uncultured Arthrobacter sp. TaxID=114050 RepID=UPI0025E81BDA|nr:GrpB family protein [uncultured Arthrobacter sp.]